MKTTPLLLIATLALLLVPSAFAAKSEVEKKLAETHVTVELKAITAPVAFRALSDLSGVPITLKNVPDKKRFSLTVQDVPLREAVEAVCRYYKLDWVATDDGITVRGMK